MRTWFREREWWGGQNRLIVDTLALGVIGALSAQLFSFLLRWGDKLFLQGMAGFIAPGLPNDGGVLKETIGSHGLWLIPIVVAFGGIISGFLVYTFAPEAEGHGTDTAVDSYHRNGGFLRARVPALKMIASAITIGSGGAAGREGPTALISAGIGSIYATLTRRSEEDRRLLVLIGMAAGLSAIFRSPIGTAIFAIEVLYKDMEFDVGALLYTMIGSVVAYAINGMFVGWQPLFQVPPHLALTHVTQYFWYILLGGASGVIASILPTVFYGTRDMFHRLPLPPHVKPAIGGLGVGLIALVLPQVLGGGYGWIQMAINGQLALKLLLVLTFAKMAAFALTVSSGGSGGVFAPSLFVGAMLGGAVAQFFHQPSADFVIVGMAAVFGGAARVPVATLLMVTEMTGGYDLLVPAALAVMLSYIIQTNITSHWKYDSMYEAQVPGRADSPAHHLDQVEAAIHLLGHRSAVFPGTVSHVDLRRLLVLGIPVDLPDEKRLMIGVMKPQSPYIGKSIQDCFPLLGQNELEVIAVFRGGHTILPNPNVRLRAGDRLLFITSQKAWRKEEPYFMPPKPA